MSAPEAPRDAERRRQVLACVNALADPCSAAAGDPVGLADMGLVTAVELDGDHVAVHLRPTFPGCLFVGVFEQQIRTAVGSLEWCAQVAVQIDSSVGWSERDMAPDVRARVQSRRGRARRQLAEQRRGAHAEPTGASRWTS